MSNSRCACPSPLDGEWLLTDLMGDDLSHDMQPSPFNMVRDHVDSGVVWYSSDVLVSGSPLLEVGVEEYYDVTTRYIKVRARGQRDTSGGGVSRFWTASSHDSTYEQPEAFIIARLSRSDDACYEFESLDLSRLCTSESLGGVFTCMNSTGGLMSGVILQRKELCGDNRWNGEPGEPGTGQLQDGCSGCFDVSGPIDMYMPGEKEAIIFYDEYFDASVQDEMLVLTRVDGDMQYYIMLNNEGEGQLHVHMHYDRTEGGVSTTVNSIDYTVPGRVIIASDPSLSRVCHANNQRDFRATRGDYFIV